MKPLSFAELDKLRKLLERMIVTERRVDTFLRDTLSSLLSQLNAHVLDVRAVV